MATPTADKIPPSPPHLVTPSQHDWNKIHPLIGWLNTKTIQKTFDKTTQYTHTRNCEILKTQFKSPYTWANVARRNENLATDTVFSNTPAIDSGRHVHSSLSVSHPLFVTYLA